MAEIEQRLAGAKLQGWQIKADHCITPGMPKMYAIDPKGVVRLLPKLGNACYSETEQQRELDEAGLPPLSYPAS